MRRSILDCCIKPVKAWHWHIIQKLTNISRERRHFRRSMSGVTREVELPPDGAEEPTPIVNGVGQRNPTKDRTQS